MANPAIQFEVNWDIDSVLSNVAYDMKVNLGVQDPNQKVVWGNVVSGSCHGTFIGFDNVSVHNPGVFFFDSSQAQTFVIFNSAKYNVYGVSRGSGTATPSINFLSSVVTANSGGSYDYYIDVPGSEYEVYKNKAMVYTGTTFYTLNAKTYQNSTTDYIILGSTGNANFGYTTDSSGLNSGTPCLPIAGENLSYNDIKGLIVENYNEQNPSETISESDLPEFEETQFQGFTLDYDEILSERELESILKETQYILDTTPLESIEIPTVEIESLEIESLPSSVGSAVGEIFDISAEMPPDLLAVWGGLAVFAVLFWYLTK